MVRNNTIIDVGPKTLLCKFCGSSSVVRYGFSEKRRQRHFCLNCNRTFIDNAAPERMRYPTEVIASALNQFYEGRSLNEIKLQLEKDFSVIPDPSSIYDWIFHYTKKAIETVEPVKPRTGHIWLASQTSLKLKSVDTPKMRIFDCIDEKSCFLLASHLTQNTNGENAAANAVAFMEAICQRTGGQKPKTLITDKLQSCLDLLKKDYGVNTRQISRGLLPAGKKVTGIQQLRKTLRSRTAIMSSLTCRESAHLVMNGWGIHYNFFRPHPGLNGRTPARAAGVDLPSKSWAEIIDGNHRPGVKSNVGDLVCVE